MTKRVFILVFVVWFAASCTARHSQRGEPVDPDDLWDQWVLLQDSLEVLKEMNISGEDNITWKLLNHAKGVVILPSMLKGGFIGGIGFGDGVVSIRSPKTGEWGPPLFIRMRGASFGFQAGIEKRDLVFLVVSERGRRTLFKPAYNIGEEISVVAGPLGGHTGITLQKLLTRGDIFAYSRSQGIFAGAAAKAGVIDQDEDANAGFYGRPLSNRNILLRHKGIRVPDFGLRFMKEMNKLAPGRPMGGGHRSN